VTAIPERVHGVPGAGGIAGLQVFGHDGVGAAQAGKTASLEKLRNSIATSRAPSIS